jgi:epoxyqueuosine reductase
MTPMSPATQPAQKLPDPAELMAIGRAHGLDAVGIAPATPFATTRRHLEQRKTAGLHGQMAFTYRRPARSTDPSAALSDARALVVGARSYRRAAPSEVTAAAPEESASASSEAPAGSLDGLPAGSSDESQPAPPAGRVARYAWEDHYQPLRAALSAIAARLKAEGWRTRVAVDDNALVDREAAYRAGLGWYGKNANLLLPGQGSWFVLGSVITDAPLPPTRPDERVPDGCGSCTKCMTGCPTGAIVAPGVVDARRCLAWLVQAEGWFPRQHRVALGDRIYGCDDCQEVCPPNRRLDRRGAEPAPAGGHDAQPVVDLLAMLAASDEELLARHGRWYIPRRQPRYLRRNALIALGNVADPRDPEVTRALARALADPDPIVRGHAAWAVRRLGHGELAAALAEDPDPAVRTEATAEVETR